MIFDSNELLLMFFIALGSYIQATTGFAFGLIVMAGATALNLCSIESSAFIISILGLVNCFFSLRGNQKSHIDITVLFKIILPCIPATIAGVWLLSYLGNEQWQLLKTLLGVIIIGSSVMMLLKPHYSEQKSSNSTLMFTGLLSGFMGGIYATFGPPVTYIMYRQPVNQDVIRATLLALFTLTGLVRVSIIISTEPIEYSLLLLCAITAPIVILTTIVAKKYHFLWSNDAVKKLAFTLLFISGIALIFG